MGEFGYPVQILTKSTLVRRDLDLLERINGQSRALVCFSVSSVDERISRIYEPGVPSPSERLETLKFFKARGISCGLFLLPVIPFVTDTEQLIERALQAAANAEVDYLIFGGMTLKEGRQSSYFLGQLARHHPELLSEYRKIYRGDRWGQATGEYYRILNERFRHIADRYPIPLRMPPELFRDLLDERDRVVVMLDQMDYLFRLRGKSSACGYAARSVSRLADPIREQLGTGKPLPGISGRARDLIEEILRTGTAREYEQLLRG
jgi:DNA repair photolyase